MEKWLSDKFRVMSFILMIMVVILHANVMNLSTGISHNIQAFITEGITRVAVPSFFFISGFLLMFNYDKNNKLFFINKIISRVKTLFVPWIIWSILGLVVIYVIQEFDIISYSLSRQVQFGIKDILSEIFVQPTISFQLWFVRDLFVLVLLSPIIFLIIKYLRCGWMLGCFILVCFNIWRIGFLEVDGLIFFGCGMYVSLYHKEWMEYRWNNNLLLLLFVGFLFIIASIILTQYYRSNPLRIINIILGAITIWGCYDLGRFDIKSKYVNLILSLSFFIFLFHEPLLGVVKNLLMCILPMQGNLLFNITYILSTIITIAISIIVGMFAKLRLPAIYKVLNGGR